MVLVARVKFLGEKLQTTIPLTACHNDSVKSSCQISLMKHQLRKFISQSKPQLPVVSMDVFLIVRLLTYMYITLLTVGRVFPRQLRRTKYKWNVNTHVRYSDLL